MFDQGFRSWAFLKSKSGSLGYFASDTTINSNRPPEAGDRVLGYKAGRTVAELASLASARSDGGTAVGRTDGRSDERLSSAQLGLAWLDSHNLACPETAPEAPKCQITIRFLKKTRFTTFFKKIEISKSSRYRP